MKYALLKAISNVPPNFYEQFVRSIALKKRNIPELNNDYDIKILATAAPYCYANIIAKHNHFHKCIGTNSPKSSFNFEFENNKEIKKNNVMKYLASININEIDVLITDHIDDLPLMKVAKRNLIIAPNRVLKSQLKLNSITFEEI
jgi:phosphoserine phosphatase